MICEICERPNAESRGLRCSKYNVCSPCLDEVVEARMQLLGRAKQ